MGVGKYSPTVNRWYRLDQRWHDRHRNENEWNDRDGYDRYGYHHETGLDRAGYTEWDYLGDGKWVDLGTTCEEFVYDLYDRVMREWADAAFPWEKID